MHNNVMAEHDEVSEWRVREAEARYARRRVEEIERYGEDGYKRRRQAIEAVLAAVFEKARPSAEEALSRGFKHFSCDLPLTRGMALSLTFADGKGHFYRRSLGLEKLMRKHLSHPRLPEYCDICNGIRSQIRKLKGIEMMQRGMRIRRVSAKNK
jgi:hypothetical protein